MNPRHTSFAIPFICALLCAAAARGAWVYTGELTVAAGQTNASETVVIRGGESATNHVSAIDRVAADNFSGGGTGAVSFTVEELPGRTSVISASTNLPPGSAHADRPQRDRAVVAGSVTNAADGAWYARYVTVSVLQTATNSTPTVYRHFIGTR